MKAILNVMEHDLRNFVRYKFWIIGLITMNLADLFIMAIVYSQMVRIDLEVVRDYFRFFSPGLTITGLFAAAFMIGREVNWEVRRSVSHYMLSLPIERWELAAGRILAGGVRGMVYMSPLLLTTFIFLGFPSLVNLLIILGALFLLAMGTAGLSIAIAVSTRSFEKFVASRSVLYYLLFFCSTIFYPMRDPRFLDLVKNVMPQPLIVFAQINPLSGGADMIRSYLLGTPALTLEMPISILIFSGIFATSAAVAYIKIIERE